jgi:predicted DNA-binding transcriptional regulator AlpA
MNQLIDITEIAEILKVRREYVRDRVVKLPDFPAPAITLSQRVRRWRREDVVAWASPEQEPERKPGVAALLRPA